MVAITLSTGNVIESSSHSVKDVIANLDAFKGALAVKLNHERGDDVSSREDLALAGVQSVIEGNKAHLEPVTLHSTEGVLVYKKSLVFLLAYAYSKLRPGASVHVQNALGSAYYIELDGKAVAADTVAALTKAMKEAVAANLHITRETITYAEAMDYFTKANKTYSALLLKSRTDPLITVHKLGDYMDLARSPLVGSTAGLDNFELQTYDKGLLLRYPLADGKVAAFKDEPNLTGAYNAMRSWASTIGLNSVGAINQSILEGRTKDVIQLTEAYHDKQFVELADRIAKRGGDMKLILIAGPSSSCKTTFAHRLTVQLRTLGLKPVTISVDDYYNGPEKVPLDAKGNRDYERIEALNTETLNQNLIDLFAGRETECPRYDFHTQRPLPTGRKMKLPEGGIVIMEGIHCLNEKMTEKIPRNQKFMIMISPMLPLSIDDLNQVGNTSLRLVRRMVRDYLTRGHSALKTLQMWPAVRHGEVAYIFPNQNNADAVFNSGHPYEVNIMKTFVEPLLHSIPVDSKEYYGQARIVLDYLKDFLPMSAKLIPPQSLVLEFIGGSWYYNEVLCK
eukprot:tig00020930_g16030.t1